MRVIGISVVALILGGCVSGAPILNHEQKKRLGEIEILMDEKSPEKEYEIISELSAADCSGPGGTRLYGDVGKAIDILKAKAAFASADAVINVNCGSAPLVNNCWAAKKCDGAAVKWKK